jgi:protein disulfide-isomerase-like protein
MLRAIIVPSAVFATCQAAVQTLTMDNFATQTTTKGAFVKFFAPWCGHCKAMKPDWDRLGGEYDGSETHVIGDVDCTVEKALCATYGIKGYPSLKYFPAGSADALDYEGGRTLEELRTFASTNLGPSCDSNNKDLCGADDLTRLEEIEALGAEEVATRIAAAKATIADADSVFNGIMEGLQEVFEEATMQRDTVVETAGEPLVWLMRASFPETHDEL